MKFKIGDKVKVVKKYEVSPEGKHVYGWAKKMDESVGRVYTVRYDDFDGYGTYQLDNGWYYLPESLELVEEESDESRRKEILGMNLRWSACPPDEAKRIDERNAKENIDSHYNFTYVLTEADKKAGKIRLDPYFVSQQWNIGGKDASGVIWHIFKTCARFGEKNTKEREIVAIYKSIRRLAELEGVKLL